MVIMVKNADPECFKLADYFLRETAERWRGMHRQELALAVQQAVEDYFLANPDLRRVHRRPLFRPGGFCTDCTTQRDCFAKGGCRLAKPGWPTWPNVEQPAPTTEERLAALEAVAHAPVAVATVGELDALAERVAFLERFAGVAK